MAKKTGIARETGLTNVEEIADLLMQVQSQLAFQEETLRELNDAMARQQQEMLVLRRQLQLLKERQDELTDAQVPAAAQEKPPHY